MTTIQQLIPITPMPRQPQGFTITPEIEHLLAQDPVVAVSISGGKDSQACALAVQEHLDRIGHTGVRCLVHCDLGRVEWKQSIDKCEEIAKELGWELIILKRNAGDMMDRWLVRWRNNVARYQDLSCVQLILPWSTPSMRFCTSEGKTQLSASALRKRFPGQNVVNVTGIRRQESANRSKMPVSKDDPKIVNKGGVGATWNAIIDWSIDDVFHIIERRGLRLHEAYTTYGMTRVSCAFCIMSSGPDMRASTDCPDNHQIYREMVELEATSTFAFQSNKWLADVRPDLLGEELVMKVARAKSAAQQRQAAEARIPKSLLYTKGWPSGLPTLADAQLLADVRCEVAEAVGIDIQYRDADSVLRRYQQLLEVQASKQ